MTELIVYACPVGKLAEQIEAYLATTRLEFGESTVHRYPAHCTLTGFFHDHEETVLAYTKALDDALTSALPTQPEHVVTVVGFRPTIGFHHLALESAWLRSLARDFASRAESPTRRERKIRLEDYLHLTLARGFNPQHQDRLAKLAGEKIDLQAAVQWQLRFYERLPGSVWNVRASWPLG
jgi:hypothetical protein